MSKAGMMNTVAVGIAVQSDWENRQFSSSLSLNVRRLFEFLLQFGKPVKLSFCSNWTVSLAFCCVGLFSSSYVPKFFRIDLSLLSLDPVKDILGGLTMGLN